MPLSGLSPPSWAVGGVCVRNVTRRAIRSFDGHEEDREGEVNEFEDQWARTHELGIGVIWRVM